MEKEIITIIKKGCKMRKVVKVKDLLDEQDKLQSQFVGKVIRIRKVVRPFRKALEDNLGLLAYPFLCFDIGVVGVRLEGKNSFGISGVIANLEKEDEIEVFVKGGCNG